jgi:hypothetical protein
MAEKFGSIFKSENKTVYEAASAYRNDILLLRAAIFAKSFTVI